MYKDKPAYQSKKFIAFIFSMAIIAATMVAIAFAPSFTMGAAIVGSVGMLAIACLGIAYVISTAALDKFLASLKDLGDLIHGKDTDTSGGTKTGESKDVVEEP